MYSKCTYKSNLLSDLENSYPFAKHRAFPRKMTKLIAVSEYVPSYIVTSQWILFLNSILFQSRGKSDWRNGTYPGAVTGGIIRLRDGIKARIIVAVGFAALSRPTQFYIRDR